VADLVYGFTEPRISTRPLAKKLTPKTSRGFEVVDFARDVLKVKLFPWQVWLLIHMLELDSFGLLRFRKALVIVGRQNGKTLIGAVLAAYWLYVDAGRWPDQLREFDFVIVGAAQKLDIAMKPWKQVRRWGAPDDLKVGIAPDRVPMLQEFTYPPRTTNGETELKTHGGATYLPRTFDGARGQSAARLLLDELRQQYDYEGWSAIEKSANAMYDSLLVTFSNAGTARSKVLKDVREIAHEGVDDPETEWFVAEWSAEPDAPLTDPKAFAQANPSAGYLPGMSIKGLMRTAEKAREKAVERIEVLGQWVTSEIVPYIEFSPWAACADAPEVNERGELVESGSQIAEGARAVMGVDVSGDRKMSYVAVAGARDDGLTHVEVIARRAGSAWLVDHCVKVREKTGINEVALQGRGAPVSDLVDAFKREGFVVHDITGTPLLNAAGRLHDAVRESRLRHRSQAPLDMAVENGTTRQLNGMPIWDREKAPVDIAPIIAVTMAMYALEQIVPAEKKITPPPPPARIVRRDDGGNGDEGNVAFARF
jgi:phage terminase large subunit-like protein